MIVPIATIVWTIAIKSFSSKITALLIFLSTTEDTKKMIIPAVNIENSCKYAGIGFVFNTLFILASIYDQIVVANLVILD